VAISRVIEWSTSLCGFIPESPDMENVVIEEEQINHIRETRVALMLERDLLESEEAMLDFREEQTEVELQLAVKLEEEIIREFIRESESVFFK
jgi:hypothetical protein